MGSYNLLVADVKCSNCKNIYRDKIQFKYGDTWQLEYKIGDELKWGGNDIGNRDISKVKVYGVLDSEECPICGKINTQDEFDIYIDNNIIVKVEPMISIKDYFENEGNYQILK